MLEDKDVQGTLDGFGATVELAKARVVGGDTGGSTQIDVEDTLTNRFMSAGALLPPYDPDLLGQLFEHSNSLRQNVDAYATNIDGFGYRLEPIVDLESSSSKQVVVRAMKKAGIPESKYEEQVAALREEMIDEHERAALFFEFCCDDSSFVELRRQTRQDLEVTGNAYWEVTRYADGELSEFVYLPAHTVRLMPRIKRAVSVTEQIPTGLFTKRPRRKRKQFRKYVQIVETRKVFFKEFGDPRVMSSRTGHVYKTIEEMKESEPNVAPSTEVIHFRIHSAHSPYGVPRWIGNLLAVLGSRQSEEVNYLYFENKGVPPMAVLVSGGRIQENSVKRIEDYINTNLKGKRNFHKILIIEADTQSSNDTSASRMKIQIVPLLGAQHSDALFQKYDERNIDKVGMSFRLPRMLRGDIRDFNRSTAVAAIHFAETQVFQPEREAFDFIINRKILPQLAIRHWKFDSLAPVARDPEAMSQMVRDLSNAGALVPADARELAEDVFNKKFKKIDSYWLDQPLAMTVAGFFPGNEPAGPGATTSTSPAPTPGATQQKGNAAARLLLSLRRQVANAIAQSNDEWLAKARAGSFDDVEVITLPADTFREFGITPEP